MSARQLANHESDIARTRNRDAQRQARLRHHPHLIGSKNDWRIRVGDHRVIYEIADEIRIVRVNRVSHRREVYRRNPSR